MCILYLVADVRAYLVASFVCAVEAAAADASASAAAADDDQRWLPGRQRKRRHGQADRQTDRLLGRQIVATAVFVVVVATATATCSQWHLLLLDKRETRESPSGEAKLPQKATAAELEAANGMQRRKEAAVALDKE